MLLLFLLPLCQGLSWKCDYSEIDGPSASHVLYKEDNVNVVKWLEQNEYCRAKGDPTVYTDAGQRKCEYSRNICVFYYDKCIVNPNRVNDPLEECQALLRDNVESSDLDSGRIQDSTTEKCKMTTESTETLEAIETLSTTETTTNCKMTTESTETLEAIETLSTTETTTDCEMTTESTETLEAIETLSTTIITELNLISAAMSSKNHFQILLSFISLLTLL
jgi:hypothetical protein